MKTETAFYPLTDGKAYPTHADMPACTWLSPFWRRTILSVTLISLLLTVPLAASALTLVRPLKQTSVSTKGLPLIRNYTAEEYGAHNRNFDVETGPDGTVFFANFEGLLYYDHAQWRIVHTPEINRITVVYRDSRSTIWVGGYNFFARVGHNANGELYMRRVENSNLFRGEVMEIFEDKDTLQFLCSDNNLYCICNNKVELKCHVDYDAEISLKSEIVSTEALKKGQGDLILDDITQEVEVGDDMKVLVRQDKGLLITDEHGNELYTITEDDGLCSNQVAYVAYDGHGLLWGATAHGIFSIEIASPYTYLLRKDGLSGEIHTIMSFEGYIYVGGSTGLFRLNGNKPHRVGNINGTCWSLCLGVNGMYAATSSGIYLIGKNGSVSRLTRKSTTAILTDGAKIYAGETDGVYLYERDLNARKVCDLSQVTKMEKLYLRPNDNKVSIWLQNVYGIVYHKGFNDTSFKPLHNDTAKHTAATIVNISGKRMGSGEALPDSVLVIGALDTIPFPYPAYSTIDRIGNVWLTDKDAKSLYQWQGGYRIDEYDNLLKPLRDIAVGSLYCLGGQIWIGSDDMLVIVDTHKQALDSLTANPKILFRSIIFEHDSVLWGGYGSTPQSLPDIDSHKRHLRFVYTLDHTPLTGKTFYRYRLNDDIWSAWSEKQEAEFINLPPGSFTLSVQALLANGQLSKVASIDFNIDFPLFIRWYMLILYLFIIILLIVALFRYRLKKLNQDKMKLEQLVQERTADLLTAQHELIRQEKMATVGKLTQGLIDRILNPMNYIINFSKLSEGLVKDIRANIEANKDGIDKDDYEDTEEVLTMLTKNLTSVDRYGQNTTRILKAMEELLKDRTVNFADTDLAQILKADEEMLQQYFAKDIEAYHIRTTFNLPDQPMPLHGNAEMLSKTIMGLIGNSVYAIIKKAKHTQYDPEITLTATMEKDNYVVCIHDNGIGIEGTILNKIFDPFFTTKTSDEATGVGLYLSREIIQNHGGDITVESVKDKHTEFTITIPIKK